MYNINEDLLKEKDEHPLSKKKKRNIVDSFKEINNEDKILVLLSHIEGNRFKASKENLHQTFFSLSEQFSENFEDFHFTNTENYPFSKRLDDIFFRFQNCKAISMKNPNYKIYLISEKTKDIIKKEISPRIRDEKFNKDLPNMIQIIKDNLEI